MLFVIRVAGNVLGDAVLGTVDFSLQALADSVRLLMVLGHTNCSAVKGAVEAYLEPRKLWSKANSPFLRLIFQRIFVAVRESDNGLREVWGADANKRPGYRDALLDISVCMNAAHSAFALKQEVEHEAKWDIDVAFGVYDVLTHQVCMPLHPGEAPRPEFVDLSLAPSHPREFCALAENLATLLLPYAGEVRG